MTKLRNLLRYTCVIRTNDFFSYFSLIIQPKFIILQTPLISYENFFCLKTIFESAKKFNSSVAGFNFSRVSSLGEFVCLLFCECDPGVQELDP